MPSLREVQEAIARNMLSHDDDAATYVIGNGLAPAQRLSIYRNTFVGALVNALRLAYPAVLRLVGADFFEGAARAFIDESPPRSACLDEYSPAFVEFLEGFRPAAGLAYLPDVARLEWAVNRALHAPDVEPMDVALLAAVETALHGRIRFVVEPSVGLLRSAYPVDAIWRAVLARDDDALSAIDLTSGRVWLLVQRLATGVDVKRIDESAYCFARALFESRPLDVAIAASVGIDAPALLADHLLGGRFVAFTLGDAPASENPS